MRWQAEGGGVGAVARVVMPAECGKAQRICHSESVLAMRTGACYSMSLRGAKRRDNPLLLRQHMAKGNTLGEYERCCGFAQSSASLPGFPAETRIAAPVCALVRNDKFGRYARGRAVVQCTTSQPGDADCRTSAIQAAHPSPRLFRRKSRGLSRSAASPPPGRTGAPRFPFCTGSQ